MTIEDDSEKVKELCEFCHHTNLANGTFLIPYCTYCIVHIEEIRKATYGYVESRKDFS